MIGPTQGWAEGWRAEAVGLSARLASALGSVVDGRLQVSVRGCLSVGSLRDDHASAPAGRAPPLRRMDRLGVDPAARDHPSDHRVGIPHLARAELITAPHRGWHLRYHVEHAPSELLLIAEAPGTVDGLGDVRYVATAPQPDLVAENPQSATVRPESQISWLRVAATSMPVGSGRTGVL